MASDAHDKILVAALELFSHRGYAAVGTKAIAEAAGVNEVTLFRNFGSKEGLWLEVFRRFVVRPVPERLLAEVNGDPAHDLECAARAIVALIRSNIKLLRMSMMDQNQHPEIQSELASHPSRTVLVVADHLRTLTRRGPASPDTVARTLVDTLFGVGIHFEGWGRGDGQDALNQWLDDFLPLFIRGALGD